MAKYLFSIVVLCALLFPYQTRAQALFDIQSIKGDPSLLFPILSESDWVGTPDDVISISAIKKVTDRCLTRIPKRFTPDAHQSYCTCTAAATKASMNVGNMRALQKPDNRKLGNEHFEKYVSKVMKPCLGEVIQDIEYMSCISSPNTDWRIRLPVPYCKCASRRIQSHFLQSGLEEMMVSWGRTDKDEGDDPTVTLWNNTSFLAAREDKKEECVRYYLHPNYYK